MKLILESGMTLEVLHTPVIRADYLRFDISEEDTKHIPAVLTGAISVVEDIVWPTLVTSEENIQNTDESEPFVLYSTSVEEWLRYFVEGASLHFTNAPIPEPLPEPAPPVIDPLTETQLAVAELAQVVEDNNTANQLAIAELAGIILGG